MSAAAAARCGLRATRLTARPPTARGLASVGAKQRNNALLAGALFAFTGGVYYTAMRKMRQTDDLAELEELEGKVNVHESGLKVTRPRSVHGALQPARRNSKPP
mmetsp:Transcript_24412/g.75280  ORF Transcript_24412/g.75280 Transcript_24412/m.75280 type:complete len:104 (+) Transcript_24412:1052-1363(+)